MTPPDPLDAVILASSPHAQTRVLGLSLVERGRRVAARLGARRVFVLDQASAGPALVRWHAEGGDAALLVLQAGDQVVHLPLCEPLVGGTADRRVAVGPDGGHAGALWARGDAAREAIAALAAVPDDAALARSWRDAEAIPHGPIARHPATTRAERAAAEQMLLQLLVKAEDGPVTRHVYRPVSRPLTRLLVRTPITPNQVSILVGIIGLIGCWLTARPGQAMLIAGAALVLAAGFLDGCDGEIARLRLTSSKFGAWIDTVVDELTTTVYFLAIGYHTYLASPADWVVPSMIVGTVCYVATVYGIYHFLIVVSKTGNSQHYLSRLELVDDPVHGVGLRPPPVTRSTLPPWVLTVGGALAQVVRRDFINLGSLALALVNGYLVIYLTMLAGGIVSAVIITAGHVRLRGQLRELRRRGVAPRLLAPQP